MNVVERTIGASDLPVEEWPAVLVEPLPGHLALTIFGLPQLAEFDEQLNLVPVFNQIHAVPEWRGHLTLRQTLVWTGIVPEGLTRATEIIKSGGVRLNGKQIREPRLVLTHTHLHPNFAGLVVTVSRFNHGIILVN